MTITNALVVPYNREPTSADHRRQDTPCYQDEALLLHKYSFFVVRLKKKKNKAATLVPGKEASGQDGLHRLMNSVVPAPGKKTSATEGRAASQQVATGELWHTLNAQEDRYHRGGTTATAKASLWGTRIKPSLGSLHSHEQVIS